MIDRTKSGLGLWLAVAALQLALPVRAHHSVAMFELQKQLTLSGKVREFQFTNPHCFIQLVVTSGSAPTEWSIEMASPGHLIRSGWKPNTLKPGEQITVIIHPVRGGGNAGLFVSAVRADGSNVGAQP